MYSPRHADATSVHNEYQQKLTDFECVLGVNQRQLMACPGYGPLNPYLSALQRVLPLTANHWRPISVL